VNHDEIADLLGAYALDAVEPDEAARVADHVGECPRCAAELAEYHQVVGLLASVGGEAPPGLWDQIAARATRTGAAEGDRPRSPDRERARERGGRGQRTLLRATAAVAGVAAALAVLLGVQVTRLDSRVDHLVALARLHGTSLAVQAALEDPTARRVALTGGTGSNSTLAELVLLRSGSAYLINDHLVGLPEDRTYQLWGVVGGRAISLGLLGSRPATVPFTVDSAAPITLFAVTAERAGGVVVSANAPVARSPALAT